MKKFAIIAAFASTATAFAYGPGAGFTIPDNTPAGAFSTINVATAGTIVSIDSVTVTFGTAAHTWAGDLVATFSSVSTGKSVHLFSRVGSTTATGAGDSSNLLGTYTFAAAGASFATEAGNGDTNYVMAPGTYARSTHAFGAGAGSFFDADDYSIFVGDSITDDWKLTISDNAGADTGAITGWSFEATTSTVPEPASFAVLGLGALALIRRRRNNKS